MLRCNFSESHITSFEVGFGSIFSSQRSSARRRSTFTASTIVKNYKKCHLVISKLEALIGIFGVFSKYIDMSKSKPYNIK